MPFETASAWGNPASSSRRTPDSKHIAVRPARNYLAGLGDGVAKDEFFVSGLAVGDGLAIGLVGPLAPLVLAVPFPDAGLLDSLAGFFFHVRGIARKPGGWRLPVANIVMGPPIFAPLLFGVSAYLGLIASFLRPEEALKIGVFQKLLGSLPALLSGRKPSVWSVELPVGRFQQHLAVATMLSAFFSGFEALYSHYKNNFRYRAQWSPVIIAPALMAASAMSINNPKVARTWLPALSLLAILDGGIGFFYHVRGVLRRPGGLKKPIYNLIDGPPIFAPLLFAACGVLGLLACLMRRER